METKKLSSDSSFKDYRPLRMEMELKKYSNIYNKILDNFLGGPMSYKDMLAIESEFNQQQQADYLSSRHSLEENKKRSVENHIYIYGDITKNKGPIAIGQAEGQVQKTVLKSFAKDKPKIFKTISSAIFKVFKWLLMKIFGVSL